MKQVEPFVNFGTDKKGDWARCTNLECRAQYYDWDAAKRIALCPKCRKVERAKNRSSE